MTTNNINYHSYLKYFWELNHIELLNKTWEALKIQPKYGHSVFSAELGLFTFVQLTAASIHPPRVQSNMQHFNRRPTEPNSVIYESFYWHSQILQFYTTTLQIHRNHPKKIIFYMHWNVPDTQKFWLFTRSGCLCFHFQAVNVGDGNNCSSYIPRQTHERAHG